MLEAAVAAGLASAGVDVLLLGVLPTPAVAFLTAELHADLGVVISASHNAMPDNGIKIFAAGGRKLDDDIEDAIEAGMDAAAGLGSADRRGRRPDPARCRCPPALPRPSAAGDPALRSTGLTVVVDCAHGAASGWRRRSTGGPAPR